MYLRELVESFRLPIQRGEIPKARGSYGAFIITLSPSDFLKLTTPNQDSIDAIKNRHFPAERDDYFKYHYGTEETFGKYNLPFLKVTFPEGRVIGHEGRHRAAMIERNGGDKIPVIIYPYEDIGYEVTYSFWEDGYNKKEVTLYGFKDEGSAEEAAQEALLKYPEDDRGKISVRWSGNKILKGEPSRSNSEDWCYAAWKKEDFPRVLRGQYSEYTTSEYQIGLVKGYRHYRC